MKSKLSAWIAATGVAVAMACGIPRDGMADNVYTFDGPQFGLGQATPLLNKAPNSGNPAFNTSFTSASPYIITDIDESGVIVGQSSGSASW